MLQNQTLQLENEIESKEITLAPEAQIRSRIKEIEEAEKNRKYFINLEKRNGSRITISNLKINNRNTDNPGEILQEIKNLLR